MHSEKKKFGFCARMGTAFTAALFLCFPLPARAQNVFLFNSTDPISISDGGPANPYPSILVTSNITGVIFAATTVDGTCFLAGGVVICQLGDISAGSNEVVEAGGSSQFFRLYKTVP